MEDYKFNFVENIIMAMGNRAEVFTIIIFSVIQIEEGGLKVAA